MYLGILRDVAFCFNLSRDLDQKTLDELLKELPKHPEFSFLKPIIFKQGDKLIIRYEKFSKDHDFFERNVIETVKTFFKG